MRGGWQPGKNHHPPGIATSHPENAYLSAWRSPCATVLLTVTIQKPMQATATKPTNDNRLLIVTDARPLFTSTVNTSFLWLSAFFSRFLTLLVYSTISGSGSTTPCHGQGYRIWSNSLDLGLVLADSHDRIRNLATNAAALWLPEPGISVRRSGKNPYAIAMPPW